MTKFDRALAQIDEWIGPHGVPGAAAVVWQDGGIVAQRYAGEASPGNPIDEQTMFALASVTKPVTAAAVMTLVDEGLCGLDEPVGRFLPEFIPPSTLDGADPAIEATRREVTVRQLLSHTAGLPEDLPAGAVRMRDLPSLAELTDQYARLPLKWAPGSQHLYSNSGFALLGRLVERVTGGEFWSEANTRVLDPVQMRDTIARPGPDLDDRIAIVADPARAGSPAESYNSRYWRDLAMPWGGLFGSAADLARFAGVFLSDDAPILSPVTRRMMTEDQTEGVPGGVQSMRVTWPVARWGLGWEVKGEKRRHWVGDLTSPRTFCHFGAAGTLLWADPDRRVALAVFGSRATAHLWPFVPARWSRLSNAVIAAS